MRKSCVMLLQISLWFRCVFSLNPNNVYENRSTCSQHNTKKLAYTVLTSETYPFNDFMNFRGNTPIHINRVLFWRNIENSQKIIFILFCKYMIAAKRQDFVIANTLMEHSWLLFQLLTLYIGFNAKRMAMYR